MCVGFISKFYFSLIDVRNWQNTDLFHCFLAEKRENEWKLKETVNKYNNDRFFSGFTENIALGHRKDLASSVFTLTAGNISQ